ncbi:hypothetical protein I3W98_34140 [Streptomyces cavourensis]|nr:hypothetical protein [Streptomyces cavourensis]
MFSRFTVYNYLGCSAYARLVGAGAEAAGTGGEVGAGAGARTGDGTQGRNGATTRTGAGAGSVR